MRGSCIACNCTLVDPGVISDDAVRLAESNSLAGPHSTASRNLQAYDSGQRLPLVLFASPTRRVTIKTIVSALFAMPFRAGAVAPAAAYSDSMLERLDKEGRSGHGQG